MKVVYVSCMGTNTAYPQNSPQRLAVDTNSDAVALAIARLWACIQFTAYDRSCYPLKLYMSPSWTDAEIKESAIIRRP